MIDPFEKISAGFIRHALRESLSERILLQEKLDLSAQQGFGFICQGPIKILFLIGASMSSDSEMS